MAESGRRQFVKYSFFKLDSEWRRLPEELRYESKKNFAQAVTKISEQMFTRCFSLIGLRGDSDFFFWQAADTLEDIQDAAARLWSTDLGAYLTQPYSYLAMTRRSQYVGTHTHSRSGRHRHPPAPRQSLILHRLSLPQNARVVPAAPGKNGSA